MKKTNLIIHIMSLSKLFFVNRSLKRIDSFIFTIILKFIILILSCTSVSFAQNVGINATGTTPNASALLDIDTSPNNDKGLLIPRLTTAERDAIASPAYSLLIFNTTTGCFEAYDTPSTTWVAFGCIGCIPPTVAAAGVDQTLACVTTATLAGNTPTVGTGTWSIVSGTATITTPNSPTSGITGLSVSGGTVTLRWTISNAPCTPSFDDVIITTTTSFTPGSQSFTYTGAPQSFTVPTCVTSITVIALGAQGGSVNGGNGGRATATIPVTPGEVLNIYVGENPIIQIGSGWNGGGSVSIRPCASATLDGWPGGGASDVRRTPYNLANRLIVAGGGGGQGYTSVAGGVGGGTIGGNGGGTTPGGGGTQVVGGAAGTLFCGTGSPTSGVLGQGGNAGPTAGCCIGSGGGGGYYGGGGGWTYAGGGGSSYVAYPGNTVTSTTSGVNTGNGQVTISW